MKHYMPFIFLTLIICWKPTPVDKGQHDNNKIFLPAVYDTIIKPKTDSLKNKIIVLQKANDSLKEIKNDLFQTQLKYLDLLAEKKTKVVEKIVFVPVYVPVDSSKIADNAINVSDYLKPIEKAKPKKKIKRSFFYRLFHKKK